MSAISETPGMEAAGAPLTRPAPLRAPGWLATSLQRVSPDWRRALGYGFTIWMTSRLALAIATYFATFLPRQVKAPAGTIPLSQLVEHWKFWDAIWYVDVAQHGYTEPARTAFFPLYPIVVHTVHALLPVLSWTAVALLVSNLALLAALVLLVRVGQREWDDHSGRRAAILLMAYPGAFFLSSAYSESLGLALMLAAFLALRSRRWLTTGIAAAAASATLIPAVSLLVPMVYEGARGVLTSASTWRERITPANLRILAMLLPVPIVLAAIMLYLKLRFGNPLIFATVQHVNWKRQTEFLGGILWALRVMRHIPIDTFVGSRNLLDAAPILAALAVAILALRTLPLAYSLFALTMLVINLSEPVLPSNQPLQSDMRQVALMFPVFLALAVWSRRWPALYTGLLYLWLPLQGLLVLQTLNGYWII